jgi:hypothetical protein
MGDWEDMPSLSSYDVGKKCYEGRRYKEDIRAAVEARAFFNRGLEVPQGKSRGAIGGRSGPKKVSLGSNHGQGRITRVIEGDPKLDGLIGVSDFQIREHGWDFVPYLEPVAIQGFTFQHYFTTGVMGRPVGGEMPALTMLKKQFTSSVGAHSHVFDLAHRTRPDGTRLWGLVAGCYLAEEQWEDYAGPANRLWWKGLILLKGCENGDFEGIETIPISRLKAAYHTPKSARGK